MSGAEISSEIAAAIAEAGAEVGDGTPLMGSILRTTGADESTYPPTPGNTLPYACTLVLMNYSARDRDGTNITDRDVRAMIAPDAETDPRNGDKLKVMDTTYSAGNLDAPECGILQALGRTFSIVDVMPYQPGGTLLYYVAQLRAGE